MNKVVRSDADDVTTSADAAAATAAATAGAPRADAALATVARAPCQVQPAEQPGAREEEGAPL